MHVHLPKPVHGWRAFFGEISVIVLGVLIALALEQSVEALNWSRKVAQAEVRLAADLKDDTSYAAQYSILKPCTDAYLDTPCRQTRRPRQTNWRRSTAFGSISRSDGASRPTTSSFPFAPNSA
jgi:hypothetical protein